MIHTVRLHGWRAERAGGRPGVSDVRSTEGLYTPESTHVLDDVPLVLQGFSGSMWISHVGTRGVVMLDQSCVSIKAWEFLCCMCLFCASFTDERGVGRVFGFTDAFDAPK